MVCWWYQAARITDDKFVVLLCRTIGGSFSSEPLRERGLHSLPVQTYSTFAEAADIARVKNI